MSGVDNGDMGQNPFTLQVEVLPFTYMEGSLRKPPHVSRNH